MLLPDTIFLTGLLASGKDYVAQQLVDQEGYTRVSFADALKRECAAFLGVTVEELNARKAEFRGVLQTVGVSRRKQDPDHWVKKWQTSTMLLQGRVVCADLRFPNEAAFARAMGGLLLRVSVPEDTRRERVIARDGAFVPNWANHESEQYAATMEVDGELSGNLPAWSIVPCISWTYRTQQFRRAYALQDSVSTPA